jgi:hypothetical protein
MLEIGESLAERAYPYVRAYLGASLAADIASRRKPTGSPAGSTARIFRGAKRGKGLLGIDQGRQSTGTILVGGDGFEAIGESPELP